MLEAVSVKDRVGIPSGKVLRSPSFPAYYDRATPSCIVGVPRYYSVSGHKLIAHPYTFEGRCHHVTCLGQWQCKWRWDSFCMEAFIAGVRNSSVLSPAPQNGSKNGVHHPDVKIVSGLFLMCNGHVVWIRNDLCMYVYMCACLDSWDFGDCYIIQVFQRIFPFKGTLTSNHY